MPNGCTPLYDAMGQSLTKLHNRIKDDSDATAVVTVLTDGLENASKEWTANRVTPFDRTAQIRRMVFLLYGVCP